MPGVRNSIPILLMVVDFPFPKAILFSLGQKNLSLRCMDQNYTFHVSCMMLKKNKSPAGKTAQRMEAFPVKLTNRLIARIYMVERDYQIL